MRLLNLLRRCHYLRTGVGLFVTKSWSMKALTEGGVKEEGPMLDRTTLTGVQKIVLRIVENDLPHGYEPFEQIARLAGVSQEDVLVLLHRLKETGVIRRFGASVRHQRLGYDHNLMVAWAVPEDRCDEAGAIAARQARVSHCYWRPSLLPDWPYGLYTMIHGHNAAQCAKTVEAIRASSSLFGEYVALETLRELKKVSPCYFGGTERP